MSFNYFQKMMTLGHALGSGHGIEQAKANLGLPVTKQDERLLRDIAAHEVPLSEIDHPREVMPTPYREFRTTANGDIAPFAGKVSRMCHGDVPEPYDCPGDFDGRGEAR